MLTIGGEVIGGRSFEIIDRPIPETRAFAELRDTLDWAEGPLSHDSQVALLALAGLLDADPELAESVAALSWVRQGPRGEGLRTLQQLAALAREDVPLARRVAAFPWLADGVNAEEWLGLRDLALLAGAGDTATSLAAGLQWTADGIDPSERWGLSYLRTIARHSPWLEQIAAFPWVVDDMTDAEQGLLWNLDQLAVGDSHLGNLVLAFPWVQDDITSRERWTVRYLRELAGAGAGSIVGMPFLQALSPAGAAATSVLRRLALRAPEAFARVLEHPAISDGITDDEAAVVSTLWGVQGTNPDLVGALLDPTQATVEERVIELPESGEVTLTIIRTKPGTERSLDLVESAVRSIEELMAAPLPRRQVTFLFEEAFPTTFFGAHYGTHIALSPKVDSTAMSRKDAFRPIVHEVAHYYWGGHEPWLNEGVANLLETVVDGSFEDLPERDTVFPCPYARRISDLEDIGPQQRSRQFLCSYSLGFRLFRDLYRELGEDFWDGLRLLYQKSQVDDDSDDCSGTSLGACHVEAAFKAGATDEAIAAVDKVLDFWYEKRDPPPATPE